jgi:hypothetical protein
MERPEPDLVGYREAQVALIAKLGSDVEFFLPAETVWPENAILDPETGTPYDPTVLPLSSGFSSAVVRCGVSRRHPDKDDALATAIGDAIDTEGLLIVPLADYEEADLDEATEARVNGSLYEITQTESDGLGGEIHRKLLSIRKR